MIHTIRKGHKPIPNNYIIISITNDLWRMKREKTR